MVKPSEISTHYSDFIATFGKCELETMARGLVILSQRKNTWAKNFKISDIHSANGWPRWGRNVKAGTRQWLDKLAELGFLEAGSKKKWFFFTSRYWSINESFVTQLHKAQLRNTRLRSGFYTDPDDPGRISGIMDSLG